MVAQEWLRRNGCAGMVEQGILTCVGPLTSQATAKVLLRKIIAIQSAIAIRFFQREKSFKVMNKPSLYK